MGAASSFHNVRYTELRSMLGELPMSPKSADPDGPFDFIRLPKSR